MKVKFFKRVGAFLAVFLVVLSLCVIGASADTINYPTTENYLWYNAFDFTSTFSRLTVDQVVDMLPVSGFYGADGYVYYPVLSYFDTSDGRITFEQTAIVHNRSEYGISLEFREVDSIDPYGDYTFTNRMLEVSFTFDGIDGMVNLRYNDGTVEPPIVFTDEPIVVLSNENYYSSLVNYVGLIYDDVVVQFNEPTASDTISSNWTGIMGWVVGALASVQSVFFVDGNLTFIGTLAVIGVAIAVAFLIIGIVQRFLTLRG